MLLLQTGMKKAEVMALTRDDFVHVGPNTMPEVWIRYDKPRMRYKERRIVIDPEIMPLLREYLAQRQPAAGMIFDCTPRNLEYVLRDVADGAGVDRRKVSFESLRWTAALWSFRQGMPPEALRTKLGLSRISWRETSKKLAQLAADLEKIGH
jgi:integrase/recombinase XerD